MMQSGRRGWYVELSSGWVGEVGEEVFVTTNLELENILHTVEFLLVPAAEIRLAAN